MTRFTHWDRPHAYPFFDIVTRDTNDGGCFDLSVLLEDYTGSLFLRDEHVIEMARSLGMATVDEVAVLRAHVESLEAQISRLPKAQEELKNGLASLVSNFHRDLLTDDVVVSVPVEESKSDDSFLDEAIGKSESPFSL